ncbi:MAG: LysM peptidoglycan-binding domain-containing protein [Vicinamibacterales bacterium]|nr:hypothetical protein [Acidobacteriota bacterium]MDP7472157.1 LysM peptidoglycan-binding domain-containing protein [Vicinamibacterales bacterium]MDP7673045.1 LysM peptidoglycan-binding domain-containing protein [Vicinamibacterales bacterium]HJO38478.1 LysM peptidoglycan-binding domain-containing protein [Vicinamibacterales bacterium]
MRRFTTSGWVCTGLALLLLMPAAHVSAQAPTAATDTLLPVEQLSPSFLGMYRKVMEIEDEIRGHTDRYGLHFDLARAVCLYESGGNAALSSWVGARGYFQVMPATFRSLRVETNIEAGIKYLSQLVDRFDREDYAIAGYNGGPTRVGRRSPMPLETLQYVLGVGHFRSVLKTHEASIRHHASQIQLTTVAEGDDWWQLSQRLGLPIVQLRMHNPFLANRQLRVGQLIAYPMAPRTDLFREFADGSLEYITRTGDNYFNIAFTLDVDLNDMRDENDLWRLQTLPVGLRLTLPTAWEAKHTVHTVRAGETVETIAENLKSQPWRIIRDNGIWNQDLQVGATLRVREVPPRPTYLVHRVTRGENLGAIARRYGTSVSAIQSTNSLGRRTLIRIGQQLRIPTLAADQ